MDAQELERLNRWIADKWKHGACPVCAEDSWETAPNMGQMPNLLPFGPGGGNTVPVVLINCTNCGYTLAINAVAAGIVVPSVPLPTQPQDLGTNASVGDDG